MSGLALIWAGESLAERFKIPIGEQTRNSMLYLPKRGLTKDQIASQFGEPETKQASVGTPPISIWIYSEFKVYFKKNLVLYALEKRESASAAYLQSADADG